MKTKIDDIINEYILTDCYGDFTIDSIRIAMEKYGNYIFINELNRNPKLKSAENLYKEWVEYCNVNNITKTQSEFAYWLFINFDKLNQIGDLEHIFLSVYKYIKYNKKDFDNEKYNNDITNTNWVKTTDFLPKKGDKVLVYGFCDYELGEKQMYKSLGYVEFNNIDYSLCVDRTAYAVWYTGISHWKYLTPPNI